MTGLSTTAGSHSSASMRDLRWSPAEKAVARRAFNLALEREFAEVIRETRSKAASIREPSDLWDLEHYLAKRRQAIDRKYDYRYSMLTLVFGVLLREGRISADDLQGLGEDKLESIRSLAAF